MKDKSQYGNSLFDLIKKLSGHGSLVIVLLPLQNSSKLISGAFDHTIRIWNLSTYKEEKKIDELVCNVNTSILEIDNKRVIVSGNGFINVLNIETSIVEQLIENIEFTQVLKLIKIRDNQVFCGCYSRKTIKYDININIYLILDNKFHDKNSTGII